MPALIVLAAAVLLFTRLGDRYLWQDEAETAIVARNLLRCGYPSAYDGTHLLHLQFAAAQPPHYVWVFHPWVQFYLAAASFAAFGVTTWAARFPFALLGLGCVVLVWRLARQLLVRVRLRVASRILGSWGY